MRSKALFGFIALLAVVALTTLTSGTALAHCDTMDGPVVVAAQSAIEKGDVNLVLAWVQSKDEAEIQAAFRHTMEVRKLGAEAQKLADKYFFETLVRVHRAGEGAPYTGVKPAGQDIGTAIVSADKAIETKNGNAMLTLVGNAVQDGINDRFKKVVALSNYKPDDVEAGRKYVAAYVDYIHYVEGVYNAASGPAEHHAEAPAAEGQSCSKHQ